MKPSLLDTDILSQYFRGNPIVVKHVQAYLKEFPTLNFSIITYYEILNGLLYKNAVRQIESFFAFTEVSRIVLLSVRATQRAATVYATLRQTGKTIGHTDSLIAGIALENDLQLITNNTGHFSRVEGLQLAN